MRTPPPLPSWGVAPDPSLGDWLRSIIENRWHWVLDPCRYASIIDVQNRDYRRDPPPLQGMCLHCLKRWRRAHRQAS